MSVWTIVVAAGSGSRFGGKVPKQYLPLAERRVLDWALVPATVSTDGVVLVVTPDRADDPEPAADRVVAGGATRSASVRAGLRAVPPEATVILVHDAARPLASPALFLRVIEAVQAGADAVVPAVPVIDTLKEVAGDRVVRTVDRTNLVAVQTPQGFAAHVLRQAHAGEPDASDDAGLVEAAGVAVAVVAGDVANLKITTHADLDVAELHLEARLA